MPWEMVDVLILTALQDEYDAVLEEGVDALPGSSWERRMGPLGLEVALRTFRGQGGGHASGGRDADPRERGSGPGVCRGSARARLFASVPGDLWGLHSREGVFEDGGILIAERDLGP